MIEGISKIVKVPYSPPPKDEQETFVKTSVRVKENTQEVATYIYDKYGRLVTTIVKSHDIGVV